MTAGTPHVSVCIPAHDTAPWIQDAIRSVLAQTYTDFEVIVVNDASSDDTLDRAMALGDPRVRVFTNSSNLGHSGNWNRTMSLARAPLVKLLCGDDILYQDCLEEMVRVFDANPSVGLVFSRRDVAGEDAVLARKWTAKHGSTQLLFGDLEEVNDGSRLVRTWIDAGLPKNWVGEPTSVMVSRACLRRTGGFSRQLRQRADMDLWIRAMLFHDVGFIDRPLARYSVRSDSLTGINTSQGRAWLDQMWLVEGLLSYPNAGRDWPSLYAIRRRAARQSLRHGLRSVVAGDRAKLAELRGYLATRAVRKPLDLCWLYGDLEDPGPDGETIEVTPARAGSP